jgi:ABC-type uncharacterized transport system permease subunit
MILLFAIFTIILYFFTVYLQRVYIKNPSLKLKKNISILSLITIISHASLLVFFIYQYQNLNLFKLISLVCWLITFLIYLGAIGKKNIQNLYLFIFPITAFSLLLVVIFNKTKGFINLANLKETFHITLSTLTFSTICLSALLASILAIQDRRLRKYHRGFTELLPPIESMENLLFEIISIGFLLLTLVLASSFSLSHPFFSSKFLNKIILSFFAWLVLAILVGGRFYFGWRGQKAIRWTFLGTSLLLLIYISSFLIN